MPTSGTTPVQPQEFDKTDTSAEGLVHMTKITLEDLNRLSADPNADLSPYFMLDEERSGAFNPQVRLNPETVDIPDDLTATRSAGLMNAANWLSRRQRAGAYHQKLAQGYQGPIIVSEGDSWWQYPFLLRDTIDWLSDDYAIFSLGAAGDLLERMAEKREYLSALEQTGGSILLLSGGGNDLVAGGALDDYLEDFDPVLRPADYLKPSFQGLLDSAFGFYERMFTDVQRHFPSVRMLCHGYDYALPAGGRWLGKPMEKRGIRDRSLQRKITVEMMDRFNIGLWRVARRMPQVTYIDCRNTVGSGRWHDELHPTNEGYRAVAMKFSEEIRKAANAVADPVRAVSGPFVPPPRPEEAMTAETAAAPATIGRGVKALSLHLGLNFIDPDRYGGWDGELRACVNDAGAMARLAEARGFSTVTMRDSEATHVAVVDAVEFAARELREGDMFFWSVSCHGMQVPDYNGDETDDGDMPMDEALVLWDRPLVDDHIYKLWSQFKPGVRILMLPDTCHSGTMTRLAQFTATPVGDTGAVAIEPVRFRMVPKDKEAMILARNGAQYRAYAQEYAAYSESTRSNPAALAVKASVLSLSACQDDQVARDGAQYGAFTGAVLKCWSNGAFRGSYVDFQKAVIEAIGNPQQVPKLYQTGADDPQFRLQLPFTAAVVSGSARIPVTVEVPPPARPTSAAAHHPEAVGPLEMMLGIEGPENDPPVEDTDRMIAGTGTRWAERPEFDAFIGSLGLRHFSPQEFLVLGGAHVTQGSAGYGLNTPPPKQLWPNIANTARVIDELRARLGTSVSISNAYRSPAYNRAIGGAASSMHMRFNALDLQSSATPSQVNAALLGMRDEGRFAGGIGVYNTFVHVDTRGSNVTWDERSRGTGSGVAGPALHAGSGDRRAKVEAMEVVRTRARMPKVHSAFRSAPAGAGMIGDLDQAIEQQRLNAAVAGSSVVSFVASLTPPQKDDVLMSTLFAQRAADAAVDRATEIEAWFDKYIEILTVLGWVTETRPTMRQQEQEITASFDKAILQVLSGVATGNQFAVLQGAIDGLKALGEGSPAIKLFDLASTVTEGGHFQAAAAEASGGVISMALGAFHYRATDSRKNILFVSWGETSVDYWIGAGRLTLVPDLYENVRDVVEDKLKSERRNMIADIPLA